MEQHQTYPTEEYLEQIKERCLADPAMLFFKEFVTSEADEPKVPDNFTTDQYQLLTDLFLAWEVLEYVPNLDLHERFGILCWWYVNHLNVRTKILLSQPEEPAGQAKETPFPPYTVGGVH